MPRPLHVLALCLVTLAVGLTGPTLQSQQPPAAAGRLVILGSVVDANLTPVVGAAIVLERDAAVQARATSDAEGKFRFINVVPGAYRVRATRQGFQPFVRDVRLVASVATVQLPIVLVTANQEKAGPQAQDASRPAAAPGVPPPSASPRPVNERTEARAGGGGGGSAAGRGGNVSGGASATPSGAPVAQSGEYMSRSAQVSVYPAPPYPRPSDPSWYPPSGEQYAQVEPSRFQSVRDKPLSTFGADVDTASYANVRRFLQNGQLPPSDAVRVEELINYFRFNYALPRGPQPLALTTEIGECPWAPAHKLVLIGARARSSAGREIEGRNIVLLLDVSGSMAPVDRLPLIKSALGMFVDTLRPDDRLAIVTYAGSSGIALPSTPIRQRDVVQRAIASLQAGGSTNGGQGMMLAYRVARQAFIPGGVNRVILATDGDFNVGITSQHDLLRLIERERESGVFLSVFGVGTGNLKDQTMEMLADKGNGHYAYLDSIQEARRVLVRESDSTLETVAKDVKFQVEFNPAMVSRYRLIGYENRALSARDFNNDRKDGGEMGAGHTVTVLYEVVPVGVAEEDDRFGARPDVDPLRYQSPAASERVAPRLEPRPTTAAARSGEWLTVKARFKAPEGETSDLIARPVRAGGRNQHLPLASALAEFGLLLRDRPWDIAAWDALLHRVDALVVSPELAADKAGFEELVGTARGLARLRH